MRQIFSSQRVETVEGVAQLLRDAGIEVHISNGRSYRGRRSGQFSYLDPVDTRKQPTVWIVRADDQPRARELLRQARLLDTTRRDLPEAEYSFRAGTTATARSSAWAWRIRIALLLVIGAVALFIVLRHRGLRPPAPPPEVAPAQQAPAQEPQDDSRVRIQPVQPQR